MCLFNRNSNLFGNFPSNKENYLEILTVFQSERMENQLLSSNLESFNESPPTAVYCWWRSAAKFDECTNLGIQNLSKVTPRIKVLREMERLALVAPEGLDELRQKLFNYRSGDFWVPTGGIKKEEMDIPPVNTILLVGFHNAGKSSLVNLMYSVLGRSGLIHFAQTSSGSGTSHTPLFMEEHNVLRSMRSGFCVYDTPGFNYNNVNRSVEELSEWLTNGVHQKQLCLRREDNLLATEGLEVPLFNSFAKFAKRRVNCVMVLANFSEIYKALKAGDKKPLDAVKDLFYLLTLRRCNENPILILTHGDKLSIEERIDCRLKICEHLGLSETTGVYDIVCLTEYGFLADEFDPVTAYALAEAVYRALLISDRNHPPKKNLRDWAVLSLPLLMCFLGAFFAFIASFFSKLGNKCKRRR